MKSIPFVKYDTMTLLIICKDRTVLVWTAKLGVKKVTGLLIFFKNPLGILRRNITYKLSDISECIVCSTFHQKIDKIADTLYVLITWYLIKFMSKEVYAKYVLLFSWQCGILKNL